MTVSVTPPIHVLLIDDSDSDAAFVARLLEANPELKFAVQHVSSLSEALTKLQDEDFDVTVLDLSLADADGLESFEQIRALDARLPIVVLTDSDDEDLALRAIESGAQDFMSKQLITGQMLFRAIRFAIARQRKVLGFQAAADSDPLTGMPNRRHLQVRFEQSLHNAEESGVPMAMALLDLDHFKRINDAHGHFVGDAVLKYAAGVLCDSLEDQMSAARFGGEEFAWLMPGYSLEQGRALVARTLNRLASQRVDVGDLSIGITASAGVVDVPYGDTWDASYIACDVLLYEAKTSGRNRVAWRQRGSDGVAAKKPGWMSNNDPT